MVIFLDFENKKMESIEAKKGFKKFIFGIIGYLIIVLIANLFPDSPDNGGLIIGLALVLIAIFANNLLGIINGVKSIILKENAKWIKYLGLLGNIISLLLIGILLFFNSLEVIGYLNS